MHAHTPAAPPPDAPAAPSAGGGCAPSMASSVPTDVTTHLCSTVK